MEPKFLQVGHALDENRKVTVFDLNEVSAVEFDRGNARLLLKSGHGLQFYGADAQALWNLFSAKGAANGAQSSGF
jgi:hypothetical protein